MVFAYIMIVVLVAFIIFAICMVYKGIQQQQQENEQRERNKNTQKNEALENLAKLCGIESKYKSTENLEKEIIGILKTRYRTQLETFVREHKILSPPYRYSFGIIDMRCFIGHIILRDQSGSWHNGSQRFTKLVNIY